MWTKQDELFLKENYNSMSREDIAKKLGKTPAAISSKVQRMNISQHGKFTDEKKKILIELFSSTYNEELAQMLGISKTSISNMGSYLGLKKDKMHQKRHKFNKYIVESNYCKIYTTDNKYYTLIDIEDIELCKNYAWHITSQGYFRGNKYGDSRSQIPMQRLITQPNKNEVSDHINGKRWDNRRMNLRNCSHSENSKNMVNNNGIIEIQPDLFRVIFKNKNLYEGTLADAIIFRDNYLNQRDNEFSRVGRNDYYKNCLGNIAFLNIEEKEMLIKKIQESIG